MTGDVEVDVRLRELGIDEVVSASLLADSSSDLVRGWRTALDRASRRRERFSREAQTWLDEKLALLASTPADDAMRSLAAEVEAALRLSWVGQVSRIQERNDAPTTDFVVDDVNVEVYCPQQHVDEREVMQVNLDQQVSSQVGPVRVAIAIGHPTTGSGRSVDANGNIQRDPRNRALEYPANKVIDRVLNSKREGHQFREGKSNVLWLDLKHGFRASTCDCVPLRSVVAKDTCFAGSLGVWHAFYGESGSPHLRERTALEWPTRQTVYRQTRAGWFRDMPLVSAAVLSTLDGVLVFENPWAASPFNTTTRNRFIRLSELRPELSWLGTPAVLQADVTSVLSKLSWLAQLAEGSAEQVDPSP